jgi:hypothetical protein
VLANNVVVLIEDFDIFDVVSSGGGVQIDLRPI